MLDGVKGDGPWVFVDPDNRFQSQQVLPFGFRQRLDALLQDLE